MPQRSRSHVVVPFEKLDMSRIVFTDAKANERGGKFVGIRYRDDNGTMKSLAVMYGRDGHKVPFGVSANYDQGAGASGYKDGKKTTSYSLNMSLGTKDNYTESPYFKKAQEFDQLMIDMCVKNSVKWTGKRLKRPFIAGDDEDEERIRGYGALYKRMVKYSYKKEGEDNERIVNYDFAPGLVFGFKTRANDKTAADGTKEAYHTFITKFFDDNHQQVIGVDSTNVETVCPKRSEVKIVASWDSVYIGAAAISMKPKIIQIVVTPELSMENEDCLFGDGGFEDDGPPPAALGSGAGSGTGDASGSDEEPSAPARRSRRSHSPNYNASPPPSGSEGEGEGNASGAEEEEGEGGSDEEEERPATPPRRRGGRRGRARRPRGDSSDEE